MKDLTSILQCPNMLAGWYVIAFVSNTPSNSSQYEYLHTDKVPDGIEELEVPEWESDTVRDMLLPNDLDLSQFSKSNLWFDLSAYADGETEGEPDATGNDSSNAESTEEEAAGKKYLVPLRHILMRFPFSQPQPNSNSTGLRS